MKRERAVASFHLRTDVASFVPKTCSANQNSISAVFRGQIRVPNHSWKIHRPFSNSKSELSGVRICRSRTLRQWNLPQPPAVFRFSFPLSSQTFPRLQGIVPSGKRKICRQHGFLADVESAHKKSDPSEEGPLATRMARR